ncbi:hypothetical protein THASP1DRAFT_22441 [Thamnocephalis sphaerospora]|uniref:FAS1 domain-containing protein n=1 Tax=Thamnocephalis sphaerospora TaxID=78915 RepID=A0A4P9XU77_9FUNG|nr:hypothetical protein THASP1DRAFT_22441 [Thamnocephalis sphaerospora]|eukprot:RKP09767.1 hypothetical protein THASP1DRAFT_22441 [Thamnocephalis sphaerospora]
MIAKRLFAALVGLSAVMAATVPQRPPTFNLPTISLANFTHVPGANGSLSYKNNSAANQYLSVEQVLRNVDEFSTFSKLADNLLGVPWGAHNSTPLTIFVPINAAFGTTAKPWLTVDTGSRNETLNAASFASYHFIANKAYNIGRFARNTVNAVRSVLVNPALDPRLVVYSTGTETTVNCAKIYAQPIVAPDGIIYAIEKLINPWTDEKQISKLIADGKYVACSDLNLRRQA